MAILAPCAHCGKTSRVPVKLAGHQISCSSCAAPLKVPLQTQVLVADAFEEPSQASAPGIWTRIAGGYEKSVDFKDRMWDGWINLPGFIRFVVGGSAAFVALVIGIFVYVFLMPISSKTYSTSRSYESSTNSHSTTSSKSRPRPLVVRPKAKPTTTATNSTPHVTPRTTPGPTTRSAPRTTTRSTPRYTPRTTSSGRRTK